MLRPFAPLVLVFALGTSAGAQEGSAEERITRFHADIVVEPSGALRVHETIAIVARGEAVRHGIFRQFPVRYIGDFGQRREVGLEIETVKRDGEPEPFRTEPNGDDIDIYIGDRTKVVEAGPHTYELTYRTTEQLGFFQGRDELYWNVTGNRWRLAVDAVSATVHLPRGATATRTAAWTGGIGSREQAVSIASDGSGTTFRASRALGVGEGLTLAITWPAGFVDAPRGWQRFMLAFRADRFAFTLACGFMLVLAHLAASYLVLRFRDPPPPSTQVMAEPPGGLSPAALRMVEERGFDNTGFAAAVASLVAKGHATMVPDGRGYVLQKSSDKHATPLATEESVLLSVLFAGDRGTVRLGSDDRVVIREAMEKLEHALGPIAEAHYRTDNAVMVRAALLLVTVTAAALAGAKPLGPTVVLTVASLFMLLFTAGSAWLLAGGIVRSLTDPEAGIAAPIGYALLFAVIGGFACLLLSVLSRFTSVLGAAVFAASVLATFAVRELRRRRVPRGRVVKVLTRRFRQRLADGALELPPGLAGAYALALDLTDDPGLVPPPNSVGFTTEPLYWRRRVRPADGFPTLVAMIDTAAAAPGSRSAFGSSSTSSSSPASSSGSSGGGGGGGGGGGW